MPNYQGPATLAQDGFAVDVDIAYQVTHNQDGTPDWNGYYWNARKDPTPGRAHLHQPDGITGTILLNSISRGTGTFLGIGPPPR